MIEAESKTKMKKPGNSKVYDLEDRTKQFAVDCRVLVRGILKDIPNREDGKQLVRASGSVAANYIEANEFLSKKDFVFRVKVCRKEAKESGLWLNLIVDSDHGELQRRLHQESGELLKIFPTIISKSA
jgi:four helix bundle protein